MTFLKTYATLMADHGRAGNRYRDELLGDRQLIVAEVIMDKTIEMTETINWSGRSGRIYTYYIYPLGANFKKEPGNYIFAKRSSLNGWTAVYVGQTSDLDSRLADHEKEACARRNGATHVHAHLSSNSESERCREEADLIDRWKPTCNWK